MVTAWTDGACSPNPGKGGWGAVLRSGNKTKYISGASLHSTNNRMEMQAVIEALRVIPKSTDVVIVSDSNYVVKGMTEWLPGWKRKQFKGVKNVDLWLELDAEVQRHKTVTFRWVKAHNGDPMNELADGLAVKARQQL